jgi:hypothetical protein
MQTSAFKTSLAGSSLKAVQARRAPRIDKCIAAATTKKVNSYDEEWSKGEERCRWGPVGVHPSPYLSFWTLSRRLTPNLAGFFTNGLFLEDKETSSTSVYKKIEKKKLLSSVEKLGLLR